MEDFPRFDLKEQVALVTGAARGLGRAISLALAAAGADVALGLRDKNADGGLAKEIEALGRRCLPLQMDMTNLDQIEKAVDDTVTHFGHLDILVNNAGVAPGNPAESVREKDFDFTLAINLKGTFFASQAAGRVMIRQHSGRIINMSSQAGFAALPGESVYCMTKAGIAHLTKCLAVEWGRTTSPSMPSRRLSFTLPELSLRLPILNFGRGSRADCRPSSHRRAHGGSRCSRLPRIPGSVPHHWPHSSHRWWMDGTLSRHHVRLPTVPKRGTNPPR